MVTRDLLKYRWVYDKGFVLLKNKKADITIAIPIAYANSLMRALIAFQVAYRIEQMEHKQKAVAKVRESLKLVKEREGKLKEQVKALRIALKEAKKKPTQLKLTNENN